jgi:dienelactone hydrolase
MKVFSLTGLFFCYCLYIFAQKKLIDNDTYKSWSTLQNFNISNDGKYACYQYLLDGRENVLGICTTDGKYKMEFTLAIDPLFTEDNKHIIFNSPDGLAIFQTGTNTIQYIKDAGGGVTPKNGNGRWLSYHQQGDIVLRDFLSGKEKKYHGAMQANPIFNPQGTVLILQTNNALHWVSLPDCNSKIIQQGPLPNNITFDNTGTRLTFITTDSLGNNIRYYEPGMDSAVIQITSQSPGIRQGLTIAGDPPRFNQEGNYIFFKLIANKQTKNILPDSPIITTKVNLWHYKDAYLQPQQLQELPRLKNRTFTAVTSISGHKIIQLESPDTTLHLNIIQEGPYVLVSNVVNRDEASWNNDLVTTYSLISIIDGSHKTIITHSPFLMAPPKFSPGGKWITWYDASLKNYFSYEIATGIIRNITQPIKVPLHNDNDQKLSQSGFPLGFRWLTGDTTLLIWDLYDIWSVDPMGMKAPVNITGGYGRKHNIQFRIAANEFNGTSLLATDTLLLAAFDKSNKYNGIWRKPPGITAPLLPGSMDPCMYYFPNVAITPPPVPIKAKNASMYLVQCMSDKLAPNLVATSDFQSFIPLSDIYPQKDYNWMTTELHHWIMPDGHTAKGILYKPENFDPAKKYPVIFNYYEVRSHELYQFQTPALSNGVLNIPWYVSNGYLVFVPDIYYTPGHTGQSAVNSVVSAAKYLSQLPYVNASKMGLQGHSFGGYETNYIITHSTLFAAAQESAGMSDMISHYGDIGFGGKSIAFAYESGQANLRTTPWQRPDIYVENSPIFYVDKVKTPLLIMHNKDDGAVPFIQGVELFTALRRLGKPVWMLQYDGQGHILVDPDCTLDFTIRQQQFFAHYLKNEPAPVWMTQTIPATLKGIRTGLELRNAKIEP